MTYLVLFCVLLVIFVLRRGFKSREAKAQYKGHLGEVIMAEGISRELDENYHLINNVTLSTEDGSAQIDHIVVSIYGIFVIETKNMEGWIFGEHDDRRWTQRLNRFSKFPFLNPLRQNKKHVKILESLLKMDAENLFSIIAFVGSSTFKKDMPDNVTDEDGCIKYIKSKNQLVLTETEVKEIIAKIEHKRMPDTFRTYMKHRKYAENIEAEKLRKKKASAKQVKNTTAKKADKDGTICPRCGNSLVVRETKRGENKGRKFLGCSTYPQCGYMANIS